MPKKNVQKHICIYADYGCTTGFGNVTKEIVNKLTKVYKDAKFHIFAINNHETVKYSVSENIEVYPASAFLDPAKVLIETNAVDIYARIELLRFLSLYDFDLFFMIGDLEVAASLNDNKMLSHHIKLIQNHKRQTNRKIFKSVFYFPVDSVPAKSVVNCLQYFDEIITYTEYGKRVITDLATSVQSKRLRVIPHGVNMEVFKPLGDDERLMIQESIYPDRDFIVGTVNRNSTRKDVASLILGFAEFVSNNPEAKPALVLHMNPRDPSGIDVINLCEKLGLNIGEHVFLDQQFNENKGMDEDELNYLYNSFDVFITTTTAEGWGLTVTEAMAAGIPVICPLHTSLNEITEYGKNVIPILNTIPCVFKDEGEKIRYKSNPNDVAFILQNLYLNLKHNPIETAENLNGYVTNSLQYVQKLSWGVVAGKFKVVFDKYL